VQVRCTVCDDRIIDLKIIWTHLMVLLGDMGQIEARFGLCEDSVNLGAKWVHDLRREYLGHRNYFGHNRWYS
jgi:hypothetical protein